MTLPEIVTLLEAQERLYPYLVYPTIGGRDIQVTYNGITFWIKQTGLSEWVVEAYG